VQYEQGVSFTVVATRHFLTLTEAEREDPAEAFVSARRVFLPAAPGVDWLHDGAAEIVGPSGVGYSVSSRRESIEDGAGNAAVEVILSLFLLIENTEVGRRLQGDLYEWVKRRSLERRRETGYDDADPALDLSHFGLDQLSESVREELADFAKVPKARLELLSVEPRDPPVLMYAIYRDSMRGVEYAVEVGPSDATFTRL